MAPSASTSPDDDDHVGSVSRASLAQLLHQAATKTAKEGYAFPNEGLEAAQVAIRLRQLSPSLPHGKFKPLPQWFADIGMASSVEFHGRLYGNWGPEVLKVKGMADFGVPPMTSETRQTFLRLIYTAIYESPDNADSIKRGHWIALSTVARLLSTSEDPLLRVKSISYWLYEGEISKAVEQRTVDGQSCLGFNAVAKDFVGTALSFQPLARGGFPDDVTSSLPDLLQQAASQAASKGYAFGDGRLDAFAVADRLRRLVPSLPPFDPAALPKWFADIGLAGSVDTPGSLYGNCGPEVLTVKGMDGIQELQVPPVTPEARDAFLRFLFVAIYRSPQHAVSLEQGDWITLKAAQAALSSKQSPLLRVNSMRYWLEEPELSNSVECKQRLDGEECVRLTPAAKALLESAPKGSGAHTTAPDMLPDLLLRTAADAVEQGYAFPGGALHAFFVARLLRKRAPSLPPAERKDVASWFSNIGLGSMVEPLGNLHGDSGPELLKVKGMPDFEVPPITAEARKAFLRLVYTAICESPAEIESVRYGPIERARRLLFTSTDPLFPVKVLWYWLHDEEISKALEMRAEGHTEYIYFTPSGLASIQVAPVELEARQAFIRLLQSAETIAPFTGNTALLAGGWVEVRDLQRLLNNAEDSALRGKNVWRWIADEETCKTVQVLADHDTFYVRFQGESVSTSATSLKDLPRHLERAARQAAANGHVVSNGNIIASAVASELRTVARLPALRPGNLQGWFSDIGLASHVEFTGRLFGDFGPELLKVKGMPALEKRPITAAKRRAFLGLLRDIGGPEWISWLELKRCLRHPKDPLLKARTASCWLDDAEIRAQVQVRVAENGSLAVRLTSSTSVASEHALASAEPLPAALVTMRRAIDATASEEHNAAAGGWVPSDVPIAYCSSVGNCQKRKRGQSVEDWLSANGLADYVETKAGADGKMLLRLK